MVFLQKSHAVDGVTLESADSEPPCEAMRNEAFLFPSFFLFFFC